MDRRANPPPNGGRIQALPARRRFGPWRWLAAAALGCVVTAAMVVGGALTIARTRWGSEWLRRLAIPRINAALAGQISVGRFRFLGDRVELDEITLRDPEGALVARVARIGVSYSPLDVLRRRVNLRAVWIEQPALWVRRDATGETNLARALTARHPSPAPRPQRDPGTAADDRPLEIRLDAMTVRDARVDWRDDEANTAPALRRVRIVDLDVHAAAHAGGPGGGFGLRMDLTGQSLEPVTGPVVVAIDAAGSQRFAGAQGRTPELAADGTLSLTLGDSAAQISGQIRSATPRRLAGSPSSANIPFDARVSVTRVRLTPVLARLFIPSAPLKAALTVSGTVTLEAATSSLAAQLHLAAAGSRVAVTAALDLAEPSLKGLSVQARDIDLARLIDAGPPSAFSFDLDAHGAGQNLASLRGAATLRVPPGQLGGYALGPIRLRVDADRGRYKVADVLATIPGLRVTGAGEATARTMAFRAAVEVRDLNATVRSLTASRETRAPPLAGGQGRIDLALNGSVHAPALHVVAHLTNLRWGSARAPNLELRADTPDVRTPLASDMTLSIPRLDLGARRLHGATATVHATGPRFQGHLALFTPEAISLDASGAWGPRHGEMDVQRIVLRAGGVPWTSVGTTRIAFGGPVTGVEGLDLRAAGNQRLRVDLSKRGAEVHAGLEVAGLDLARLPESLWPPRLKLAGTLTAGAHIDGRADHPDVSARVTLAGGRIGALRGLNLNTSVRLVQKRVSGQLSFDGVGAEAAGQFDLPVSWPPPLSAPMMLDLRISHVDLRRVVAAVRDAGDRLGSGAVRVIVPREPHDVRGMVSGRAQVGGTGAHPTLELEVDGTRLQVGEAVAGDARLHVEAPAGGTLAVHVELRQTTAGVPAALAPATGVAAAPSAGPAHDRPTIDAAPLIGAAPVVVSLRTGLSLGALLHRPPSIAELLSTPVHLEARGAGLKAAALAALAGYPGPVGGTVSLDASLDGTPRTARGTIALGLDGIRATRFPATDGTLRVQLEERQVTLDARVTRRGATLLSAAGHLGAPVSRLLDAKALADASVALHVALGPLDLQRVGLPPETDRQPARILKGRLTAQADLTGTLHVPRVNLRADASDLYLDQAPLGGGRVIATYRDGAATADVTLLSANGGRLHLAASTAADLGYPAIRRGLDPTRMVVKARLDAQGFDLVGLSGATPGLRSVSGQLFAGIDVTGTAADPRVAGRLEWKDGGLTVTGMGAYKRAHLLLRGDADHLVLDELRADSGDGHARLTGSGDHRAGAGYAVQALLDLDKFPAYVEGQALAAISLRAKAEAQLSVRQVRAKVAIASARLALSDAKRKHLQRLASPADVILTDGGTPLNAAQARKLAAVAAALIPPDQRPAAGTAAVATAGGGEGQQAGVVILVDAPRDLWVSGKDANVELGLQPGFRVEVSDTARAYGQMIIKRGRVDVVGRRFDLKAESSARFSGPPDAPELDVSAKHVSDQDRITVLVTVKGSPGHLQIAISAPDRPDLTETQLYTLIVTGHLTFGGGTASANTPTDRAASLVGGLMAAQLQKGLSKRLPFDVLTIDAGNGLGSARLEAGTYVTSALYVGYVGRVGADPALLENRNAVHLEYELGARWSFQGEYGDAKTGSADMMWTKRY